MSGLIQIKMIRPTTLRVDSIRLELLNALRKEGRDTEADYKKCVETWTHKPKFASIVSLRSGAASVLTAPNGSVEENRIFQWVDEGTRHGYRIPSAGFARLSFRRYQAKTTPGVIGSGKGGPVGDYLHASHVTHPGIQPRLFSEAIQKGRKHRFLQAMQDAMKRGVTKAKAG